MPRRDDSVLPPKRKLPTRRAANSGSVSRKGKVRPATKTAFALSGVRMSSFKPTRLSGAALVRRFTGTLDFDGGFGEVAGGVKGLDVYGRNEGEGRGRWMGINERVTERKRLQLGVTERGEKIFRPRMDTDKKRQTRFSRIGTNKENVLSAENAENTNRQLSPGTNG